MVVGYLTTVPAISADGTRIWIGLTLSRPSTGFLEPGAWTGKSESLARPAAVTVWGTFATVAAGGSVA